MVDRLTSEHRSWNMSRIRSSGTKPEVEVRRILHSLGLRFRLNTGLKMVGKPDVVLPKHRTVVFVHGCFWHRHRGCLGATMPATRTEFWEEKFRRNCARDRKVRRELTAQGWRVVTVWSCELKNEDKLRRRLARWVNASDNLQKPTDKATNVICKQELWLFVAERQHN